MTPAIVGRVREKELEKQNEDLRVENISLKEELRIVKKSEEELSRKWRRFEESDLGQRCLDLQEKVERKSKEVMDLKEVIHQQKVQFLSLKYQKKVKNQNKLLLESRIRTLKRLNRIKAQNVWDLQESLRVAKNGIRRKPRGTKKRKKVNIMCPLSGCSPLWEYEFEN